MKMISVKNELEVHGVLAPEIVKDDFQATFKIVGV
jgi:hypothetical protein